MKNLFSFILKLILVSVAYYITGRIGLLLAVPPGQATAIWPASGIALAALLVGGYRLWPAIFLGAMGTSLYHHDIIDTDALMIAVPIAAGASLQAIFGAWLVEKTVSLPNHFDKIKDAVKLVMSGGAAACILNASIGTCVIYSAGFIQSDDFWTHFYIWWIGDFLGVITFTPALLIIFSKQIDENQISLSRKLGVSIPIIASFIAVSVLFTFAKVHHEDLERHSFQVRADDVILQLRKDMGTYLNTLVAVESFFNASEYVSAAEFDLFTDKLFDHSYGISGISWIPKIYNEQRNEFETSIKEQGYPDFEITRRFSENTLNRSESRPFYLPIAYTAPYQANKKAHGFDVHSEDPLGVNIRIEPLNNAALSGEAKATGRFPIVQNENQYGFIVYHPVYKKDFDGNDNKRAESLIGYINGIFLLPELMKSANLLAHKNAMNLILVDNDAKDEKRVLYDSRTDNFKEHNSKSYDFDTEYHVSNSFNFAGKMWEIFLLKKTDLVSQKYNWVLWATLTGGTLFAGLIGLFSVFVSDRSDIVSRLVHEKTKELESLNMELEEFAYRTSHDLRAPVASSLGLLSATEKMLNKNELDKAAQSITHIEKSMQKLDRLIQDILDLTEARKTIEKPASISINPLIEEAIGRLSNMDGFEKINFEYEFAFKAPLVSQEKRVRGIIENLISNAIKYADHDKDNPTVKIITYEEGNALIIRVEDNGLGIPEEHQDKVFGMFQRFHPQVSFGSGLGLYLLKKSSEIIKAEINYQALDQGSAFELKIPLQD